MGYDIDLFDGPVNSELVCGVCKGVYDNPVSGKCGHVFCKMCIQETVDSNTGTCPIDRKPLSKDDIINVPIPFRNLIGQLKMKCPYSEKGCTFEDKLSLVETHVNECPQNYNAEITCDKGCGLKVSRPDIANHSCVKRLQEKIKELDGYLSVCKGLLHGSRVNMLRTYKPSMYKYMLKLPASRISGLPGGPYGGGSGGAYAFYANPFGGGSLSGSGSGGGGSGGGSHSPWGPLPGTPITPVINGQGDPWGPSSGATGGGSSSITVDLVGPIGIPFNY